jgi:fluoride exporter
MKILLLVCGGAIGTLARYLISGYSSRLFDGVFPYGTLSVNLLGSLLIGFLWGVFEGSTLSSGLRSFIFIGLLGGFTTFSSFSLETLNLIRDGELKLALFNILANTVFGILLAFAGLVAAKALQNLIR